MTQHITQEVAVELSIKAGDEFAMHEAEFYTNLCNAAIQYYIDQCAKDLPVLPEWSKQDNLGGLVPSEIRMSMRDFGQQCAAHARKLALEEAEKRMLTKAAELGIYNHHATKALVKTLKGK